MREGWKSVQLDKVATFKGGGTPSKKNSSYWGGEIPWVSPKDMKSAHISTSIDTVTGEGVSNSPISIIPAGAILLVVRSGILARTVPICIASAELTVNQDLKAIIPFRRLSFSFLYYFLISQESFLLEKVTRSATVHRLQTEVLKELRVPLPDLDEQKRIVAILDEAFAGIDTAIANTEKNLANAREIFESYRDDAFGARAENWHSVELGELCTIKHGFAFKSEFFIAEGDYIVLTPGSFWENGGFRDQGKKTKYYEGEIPDGYLLEKGDFLFAMTEQAAGLLGSSLVVPASNRYLHNQRLGLVQPKDDVEWRNDFFFHQFNTPMFRSAVQASASGAKVRHTSPKKLCAIPVVYPPSREEQAKAANKLNALWEETQRLEMLYQQKLTALAELKQSLLQKAFSGELTAERAEAAVEEATA